MPSISDRDAADVALGTPNLKPLPTNAVPLNLVPQNALTALAGGAQAGTAITSRIARFTTVATIGDSAQLPAALPGRECIVANEAALSMNVFPQTGESIDAGAANAASAIATTKRRYFVCAVAGLWTSILGA